jgi:hypothetical protein
MKLSQSQAEVLALQALGYIASDEELLPRFLAVTGMDADRLRVVAGEMGTLIAVIDFIMFDDASVRGFAEHAAIEPEAVARIRFLLAGPEVDPV